MRMGRGASAVHPCCGHSRRRGNCFAPGTGRSTKGAPHFGQFIPSKVIGPLTKGIWLRHGSGAPHISDHRAWAPELYSPADASRLQEMVNPLLASKRCLRSSPLKKARSAFETDTGMVEPSCFTSTCVGPFARSSYENLTEYVCKVSSSVCREIGRRAVGAFGVPFP
jgi:hypothetical protein